MMTLKKEDKEKIDRYVTGSAATKEVEDVESLFAHGEENTTLKEYLEKDWNTVIDENPDQDVNLDHLLGKIHHEIRKNEYLRSRRPVSRLFSAYMKVAATLLLPLMLLGGLLYYTQNEPVSEYTMTSKIIAPLGARVSFNLPDGTKGMLNSGSSLEYSLPFKKERMVKLAGEAWFNVAHDTRRPFEVRTGTSSVTVLGTTFNICAFPAEQYVEVVLQEGSIEFKTPEETQGVIMQPSERLVYQNGKVCRSETDPAKYTAWTQGKLVFRGDSMKDVAVRLERWYNVSVELADTELENYSFRATFEDDSLEEVLKFLQMTSPITYEISQRKTLEDGTYEKQNVIIHLRK